MGLIKKQSITSSFIIYFGFFVGAVNTWLFTSGNRFTEAEYGLTRMLFDIAQTFFALANLGTISIMYRFYPHYRDRLPMEKRDLLGIATVLAMAGFVLLCIFTFFFKGLVVQKFGGNSPLLVEYFYCVYPFTLFFLLFSLLEAQAWNHYASVATNFFKELALRLLTSFIIVLFILKWLDFSQFIILFSLLYGVIFFGLFIYLYKRGLISFTLKISDVTREHYREMLPFGAFVFSVSLCTILARNFDAIIISSRLGLAFTGVFTFASYLTSIMEGPQRGLIAASVPVIAQAWKDNDLARIDNIYRKSAINMLLFSGFTFCVIWLNFDHAFSLFHINEAFRSGRTVLLLLGLTKIIEVGTGVNTQIIATSRLWRFDFLSTVTLVVILIPLNYLLITKYGINGSAAATLIAYFFFNVIRFVFIWWKFGMQPFTLRTLWAMMVLAAAYFVVAWGIHFPSSALVEAILQTGAYTIIAAVGIISLHVSDDVNRGWDKLLDMIKNRLGGN